jgi:hypothetical protein
MGCIARIRSLAGCQAIVAAVAQGMNRKDAKAGRERGLGHLWPQAFFASSRLCGSNLLSAPRWTRPRVVLRQFLAGHGVHRSESLRRWMNSSGAEPFRRKQSLQPGLPKLSFPAKAGTQGLSAQLRSNCRGSALLLLGPRFRGGRIQGMRCYKSNGNGPKRHVTAGEGPGPL